MPTTRQFRFFFASFPRLFAFDGMTREGLSDVERGKREGGKRDDKGLRSMWRNFEIVYGNIPRRREIFKLGFVLLLRKVREIYAEYDSIVFATQRALY